MALFDLDGVLVLPGGYRESFKRTMDVIIDRMGLICSYPGADMVELYEANLLNSEWDMLPVTLTILFEYIYQANQSLDIPGCIEMAIEQIAGVENKLVDIDFHRVIPPLSRSFRNAETPSLGLFHAIEKGDTGIPFPRLKSSPLLADLLCTTRDIRRSYSNRLFQNLVLGSDRFTQTYSIPAVVSSESFLEKYDRPLLTDEVKEKFTCLIQRGILHPAIMTFRPSLPPKEIQEERVGFAPEAELATGLIGIKDIPIIGYGRIQYLAEHLKLAPDQLIKPSPVQALAGIIAAWTKEEWKALLQASHVCLYPEQEIKGNDTKTLSLPEEFELHVFEDTINGILSTISATKILTQLGYKVTLIIWGISSNPEKIETLRRADVKVYTDFNDAMGQFFATVR